MSAIRLKFEDKRVREGLRAMARRGQDMRPALRRLRKPLREDLLEHIGKEAGPEGAWPRRKPVAGRRSPGEVLGILPKSTTVKQARNDLIARNPVPWSGVHNEGGTVGHGAVLPARPFVFMSEDFLDIADQALLDFVIGGWEKGATRG